MLGIDRQAARYTWTAALVLLLLYLVYMIRSTLFVFILALLLAYLIMPLVNALDRVLPGRRTRGPALALAYIIFVGIVVLIGVQIGSRVVEQASALVKTFPGMLSGVQQPTANVPSELNDAKAKIVQRIQAAISQHSSDILSAIPEFGLKFLTVASDLIFVVIVPILSFFFVKDANLIRQHMLDLVQSGPRRELLDDLMADVHLLLAHYMRALVLLSLATFTAYSIFFSIMHVPFGFLLAAVAAMLEFIPMLGPLSSAVIILTVAAVSGSNVLVILIFLVAYRIFQDYILSPHLMGQGVELHPLVVLFGVFAGAEVAGVAGTFLSVPVLALVRILYLRIRKARLGVQLSPANSTVGL
jgi:predicted PurR-regulated permease PerM